MKNDQFLRQIKAFYSLSRKEFSHLCIEIREESFNKNQMIFKEGEESRFVWLIKSGWVHLIRHTSAGNSVILLTMTPQEILCGVSAFDQKPYAADAIAATECSLIKISSEFFKSLLDENSEFCRTLLSICAERIRMMAEKLGGMGDPVSHRIARVLLASMSEFGNKIPFTHREIAQMIGARTETSIRTIRSLREKGFLKIYRSRIEIDQPLKLVHELNNWLQPTT